MFMKKLSNEKKIICSILLIVALIQFLFILYCNFFELKSHLG